MVSKGVWTPLISSFAVGAVFASGLVALVSCSGGSGPIVGRSWTEEHRSNGTLVSSITLTITAVGPPTTLGVTSTGGATVTATAGGTGGSGSTPPSISVPAGTLTGTVAVQSSPPGFGGNKKLTFWDSFK
ncbi:MAG: hypothetical protein HMLKMBBP_02561 [Planctomycetes bacterium]|nr:hypothetical protein [Planctomycetota bacterium]